MYPTNPLVAGAGTPGQQLTYAPTQQYSTQQFNTQQYNVQQQQPSQFPAQQFGQDYGTGAQSYGGGQGYGNHHNQPERE